jgi:hypothetical protein
MTVKEYVNQVLEDLSETELQQVAEYLAFLKFRANMSIMPHLDTAQIGTLYARFAEEDHIMAEEGMAEYHAGLVKEDNPQC